MICLKNDGFTASLERRKVYIALGDGDADGLIRVVDESGEDYLYPANAFAEIELPKRVMKALAATD